MRVRLRVFFLCICVDFANYPATPSPFIKPSNLILPVGSVRKKIKDWELMCDDEMFSMVDRD